ncbi:MAG TPA: FtsX-like permease family protein [Bacteroidales bacterium]|nr:FtsX-like permease family protein [Bacteroidales bacterium]
MFLKSICRGNQIFHLKIKRSRQIVFLPGKIFLIFFSFSLIAGEANQLFTDKNSIVISEEVAMKLFNSTSNVIGKTIDFQNEKQLLVTGIFKVVPVNSSLQFDFVLSDRILIDKYPSIENWGNSMPSTYVLLKESTNIEQFNDKIARLIERKNGESNRTLFTKPYSDKYLLGTYKNGIQAGGRIEYVKLFSIIAVFILVIACINFMNLSTARASGRVKEIVMKKAMGASRQSLIFQYLAESLLIACLSVIIAIILVGLFLPQFNEITGKHITINLSAFQILVFLGITVITGLIAGSYPALYLSTFNPVTLLKGKFAGSKRELWTRKGLVVFQFVMSGILIVFVLVVYRQIEFIQNKDLGFNKENILYFDIEGKVAENCNAFLSEIRSIQGIVNASSSAFNILGKHLITGNVRWNGKNPDDNIDFHIQPVNFDFIETLGIELKEGRSFSKDFGSDNSKIICNETATKIMGYEDPVGKVINLSGENREIIGVTRDFHFESLYNTINPLLFILVQPAQNLEIIVKINSVIAIETINKLGEYYENYNPGFVFEYKFLDEDYQAQYDAEKRVGVLSRYFAGLAILISCLGLFGMAVFSAERRTREIGIRRVYGSGAIRILYLLTGDFTKLVIISLLIAIPLSYLITKNWLNGFEYRVQLEWWYFVVSGLIALLLTWFTVGTIAIKMTNVNPAKCLKDE